MRSIQSGGGGGDGGVDVTCYLVSPGGFRSLVGWLSAAVALNVVLGFVSLWSCYANHFLHWGALATWALLLAQGRKDYSIDSEYKSAARERERERFEDDGNFEITFDMTVLVNKRCAQKRASSWKEN